MPPITWKNVTGTPPPDLSNELFASTKAAELLGNSFGGLGKTLQNYTDTRTQQETDAFIADLNAAPDQETRNKLIQSAHEGFLNLGQINAANRAAQNQEFAVNKEDRAIEAFKDSLKTSKLDRSIKYDQNSRAEQQQNNANELFELQQELGKLQKKRQEEDQERQKIINEQEDETFDHNSDLRKIALEQKERELEEEKKNAPIKEIQRKIDEARTEDEFTKTKEVIVGKRVVREQLQILSETSIPLEGRIAELNAFELENSISGMPKESQDTLVPIRNKLVRQYTKQTLSTPENLQTQFLSAAGAEDMKEISPDTGFTAQVYLDMKDRLISQLQETFHSMTDEEAGARAERAMNKDTAMMGNFARTARLYGLTASKQDIDVQAILAEYGFRVNEANEVNRNLHGSIRDKVFSRFGIDEKNLDNNEDIKKISGTINSVIQRLRKTLNYNPANKTTARQINVAIYKLFDQVDRDKDSTWLILDGVHDLVLSGGDGETDIASKSQMNLMLQRIQEFLPNSITGELAGKIASGKGNSDKKNTSASISKLRSEVPPSLLEQAVTGLDAKEQTDNGLKEVETGVQINSLKKDSDKLDDPDIFKQLRDTFGVKEAVTMFNTLSKKEIIEKLRMIEKLSR